MKVTDLLGGVSETKLEEEKGEEVQAGGQKQASLTSGGGRETVWAIGAKQLEDSEPGHAQSQELRALSAQRQS